MDSYETLLHRWFEEVWNQGREEVIDELLVDGPVHGLGDQAMSQAEEYKAFYRTFRTAFPDIQITVEDWVSDGNKLATRCQARATHLGEGLGFAPTQKSVEFSFMSFVRIENNKIAEAWNVVDFMKIYQQLDVVSLAGQ